MNDPLTMRCKKHGEVESVNIRKHSTKRADGTLRYDLRCRLCEREYNKKPEVKKRHKELKQMRKNGVYISCKYETNPIPDVSQNAEIKQSALNIANTVLNINRSIVK